MGYKSFIVSEGIIGLLLLGVSHVITQLEYMTIFKTVDEETKCTLMNLFKTVGKFKFISVDMQVQEGNVDCGLFAIAVATDLAYRNDPANVIFEQEKMGSHVLENLESGSFQPFPRLTKSTDS